MLRIINKFRQILTRGQKKRLIIIAFLMLIGAFLETLSVSMLLPLVTAIMQPDVILENKYAGLVCNVLDIHSARTFIIVVICGLIVLYILKNLFLLFEYYVQYRFIFNNRFAVQNRLLDAYTQRPYEFFLNANTGEFVRIVTGDVAVAFELLATLLSFFTEGMISIALVLTIFIIDPMIAGLTAVILMAVMLGVYFGIKPKLKKQGLKSQHGQAEANKWILQISAGIKEIKVRRKESFFNSQYRKYGKQVLEANKIYSVWQNTPRLIIETFTIVGVLLVIVFLLLNGREIETMLPQLTAFAMAAVRLLPSINRISTALNAITYQEPSVDTVIENLKKVENWERQASQEQLLQEEINETFGLKKEICLQQISYQYPNSNRLVLDNVDMSIPIGKSVGIIGTSGAGKTTVVDLILGLLPPHSGAILADGRNIEECYWQWLDCIGYIPQSIYMMNDTICANVAFGIEKEKIDEKAVWHALEEAHLAEHIMTLPEGINTEIGESGIRLSGGQRQRIGIARAIYHCPQVLIFDEATSALDNDTEAAIMESIRELKGKKTIIIIAHRLTTIEDCDMVYRIENSKIERVR